MKTFLALVLTLFTLSGTIIAQDGPEEIKQMLESRDNEIKELLGPSGNDFSQEQRDRLKDIINGIIYYPAMAEVALGDTYDEIEDETREEFVDLFATMIRDNSLNRLDIYRADVNYNDISVNGDVATVNTTAQLEDVRTSVDYRMEVIDNEWRITDMSIDDVSTAESYNRQFQSIIRKRGFDALLESLRRRAART
jgi:phospholipid transport system substrate-binding protein